MTCACREVNAGGLPQLYEILLDSATRELCSALKVRRAIQAIASRCVSLLGAVQRVHELA